MSLGSHSLPSVQFFLTCGPTDWLDNKHVSIKQAKRSWEAVLCLLKNNAILRYTCPPPPPRSPASKFTTLHSPHIPHRKPLRIANSCNLGSS